MTPLNYQGYKLAVLGTLSPLEALRSVRCAGFEGDLGEYLRACEYGAAEQLFAPHEPIPDEWEGFYETLLRELQVASEQLFTVADEVAILGS